MKQNQWGMGYLDYGFIKRPRLLLDTPKNDPTPPPSNTPPDASKELETLKTQNADLLKRLEALEGKGKQDPPKTDDDLAEKARKEREAKEKANQDTGKVEKALKFTLSAPEFLKTNATLLPKTIEGIFQAAENENYANAMEKADAIKVGIVTEFFAVQENLDLLTDSQKIALDDFKKLTKTDKQERVQQVYDLVFEPAFATKKAVAKAKQVRDGEVDPADAKAAYAKRMAELSKAKFIRKGAK